MDDKLKQDIGSLYFVQTLFSCFFGLLAPFCPVFHAFFLLFLFKMFPPDVLEIGVVLSDLMVEVVVVDNLYHTIKKFKKINEKYEYKEIFRK